MSQLLASTNLKDATFAVAWLYFWLYPNGQRLQDRLPDPYACRVVQSGSRARILALWEIPGSPTDLAVWCDSPESFFVGDPMKDVDQAKHLHGDGAAFHAARMLEDALRRPAR